MEISEGRSPCGRNGDSSDGRQPSSEDQMSFQMQRCRRLARAAMIVALLVGALSDIGCTTLGKSGLNPTETMILSTYPLASRKAFGTGFLVAMKDKQARGGVVPVMVTSTHLVRSAGRGAIYMPLRGFDAAGNLSVALLEVVPRQKGVPFYVRHPRFDVAAFRVRFPAGMQVPLLFTLLEEKNLDSARRSARGRGGGLCWISRGAEHILGYVSGPPLGQGCFPRPKSLRTAQFPDQWRCLSWRQRRTRLSHREARQTSSRRNGGRTSLDSTARAVSSRARRRCQCHQGDPSTAGRTQAALRFAQQRMLAVRQGAMSRFSAVWIRTRPISAKQFLASPSLNELVLVLAARALPSPGSAQASEPPSESS